MLFEVVFVVTTNFNLTNAAISYLIACIASLTFHLFVLIRFLNISLKRNCFRLKIVISSVRFGYKVFLAGIGGFIMQKLNLLFLEIYHDTEAVGYYAVALNIPNLLSNITNAISLVMYPWIANISNRKESDELSSTILRNTIFHLNLMVYLKVEN